MRYFSFIYLAFFAFTSQQVDACLHGDELINKRELTRFLKDNFSKDEDGDMIHKDDVLQVPDFKVNFEKFIDLYPYDNELKFLYARALMYSNKSHEETHKGLNLFAKALVSDCIQSSILDFEGTREFLEALMAMSIDGCSIKPAISSIFGVKYFSEGNSLKTRLPANKNHKAFINECKNLFIKLSKLEKDYFYMDACFFILDAGLVKSYYLTDNTGSLMGNITNILYDCLGDNVSPMIRCAYAEYVLMPKKKYQQAIGIYSSVIGITDDSDNLCQNYNNHLRFAVCLLASKQIEESSREFNRSLMQYYSNSRPEVDYPDEHIAAYLNIVVGSGNNGDLAAIKKAMEMSSEERAIKGIDSKNKIELLYIQALQKLGKTEEVSKILLERLARSLNKAKNKSKQRSDIVKAAIEVERYQKEVSEEKARIEEQQRQIMKANRNKLTDISPMTTAANNKYSSSSFSSEYVDIKKEKNDEIVYEKKEKKKRRGIANQHVSSSESSSVPSSSASVTVSEPLNSIEILTSNKNAQLTFYKLFSKYVKGIDSDKNVKISFNEITAFFRAIKQGLDPSKGKGSHTKGNLSFKSIGIDIDDQMLILSKETYLKPEQIKDIRLAFITARIIPDDEQIIDRLKLAQLIESGAKFK